MIISVAVSAVSSSCSIKHIVLHFATVKPYIGLTYQNIHIIYIYIYIIYIVFFILYIYRYYIYIYIYIYIEEATEMAAKYLLNKKYIYIYVCVCVCVCV